jgi:hypothetical protein
MERITASDVVRIIEVVLAHKTAVTVDVDGGRIRVSGEVDSGWERTEAARAAWLVPGITSVENKLLVHHDSGKPRRYRCPDTARR